MLARDKLVTGEEDKLFGGPWRPLKCSFLNVYILRDVPGNSFSKLRVFSHMRRKSIKAHLLSSLWRIADQVSMRNLASISACHGNAKRPLRLHV